MEHIFVGHDPLKICNQDIINSLLMHISYLIADLNSETEKRIIFMKSTA